MLWYYASTLVFAGAALALPQDARFTVDLGGSQGPHAFTVRVHPEWAPEGAKRFMEMVNEGVLKDAGFFRVVPNCTVQFGIPGTPEVAATWKAKTIKDDPVLKSNTRGMISFAAAEPNARTTMLLINLQDNAFLDSQGFAPFAEVLGNGMSVVDRVQGKYGKTPNQGMIESEGNTYLKAQFPDLSYVSNVVLVPGFADSIAMLVAVVSSGGILALTLYSLMTWRAIRDDEALASAFSAASSPPAQPFAGGGAVPVARAAPAPTTTPAPQGHVLWPEPQDHSPGRLVALRIAIREAKRTEVTADRSQNGENAETTTPEPPAMPAEFVQAVGTTRDVQDAYMGGSDWWTVSLDPFYGRAQARNVQLRTAQGTQEEWLLGEFATTPELLLDSSGNKDGGLLTHVP